MPGTLVSGPRGPLPLERRGCVRPRATYDDPVEVRRDLLLVPPTGLLQTGPQRVEVGVGGLCVLDVLVSVWRGERQHRQVLVPAHLDERLVAPGTHLVPATLQLAEHDLL